MKKDGKVLCFMCGHRVDGLLKPQGHSGSCPVAQGAKK